VILHRPAVGPRRGVVVGFCGAGAQMARSNRSSSSTTTSKPSSDRRPEPSPPPLSGAWRGLWHARTRSGRHASQRRTAEGGRAHTQTFEKPLAPCPEALTTASPRTTETALSQFPAFVLLLVPWSLRQAMQRLKPTPTSEGHRSGCSHERSRATRRTCCPHRPSSPCAASPCEMRKRT